MDKLSETYMFDIEAGKEKIIKEEREISLGNIENYFFSVKDKIFIENSYRARFSQNIYKEPHDNKLIVEMIQDLSFKMEKHDKKAATKKELLGINQNLKEQNEELKDLSLALHKQLQKSSIRHRASVYTSTYLIFSIFLFLIQFLTNGIIINTFSSIIILVSSISFWILARLLPTIEPLKTGD